ncbi:MAG: hypothetical protein ACI9CV_001658, partial [Ilumatobacter sp.]
GGELPVSLIGRLDIQENPIAADNCVRKVRSSHVLMTPLL